MSEIALSNFLFYFTSHFISQNCKLSTLEFEIISAKGKKSSGANSASAERGIVSTSTPSPPPSTGVGSGSGGHEASTSNEDYRVAFYGAGRVRFLTLVLIMLIVPINILQFTFKCLSINILLIPTKYHKCDFLHYFHLFICDKIHGYGCLKF